MVSSRGSYRELIAKHKSYLPRPGKLGSSVSRPLRFARALEPNVRIDGNVYTVKYKF